jgi:hypothetical protein
MSSAAFWNSVADEGPAASIAEVRRASRGAGKPVVAEGELVVAGYAALFSNRPKDSLLYFDAAAELYPRSANVHDSLGDAYVALGDKAKARHHCDVAQKLLDADKEMNGDRRAAIQKSIDDKRAQLK